MDLHLCMFCSIRKPFNTSVSYPSSATPLYHPCVKTCNPSYFVSKGGPVLFHLVGPAVSKVFTEVLVSSEDNGFLNKASFSGRLERDVKFLSKITILLEF